jgi:hypothetical protein
MIKWWEVFLLHSVFVKIFIEFFFFFDPFFLFFWYLYAYGWFLLRITNEYFCAYEVEVDTHKCTCGLCYILILLFYYCRHSRWYWSTCWEVRCCNHFYCSVLNIEKKKEGKRERKRKKNVIIDVQSTLDIRERFNDEE